MGNTAAEAQQNAHALIEQVNFNGMFYRKDIGYRAINREQNLSPPILLVLLKPRSKQNLGIVMYFVSSQLF